MVKGEWVRAPGGGLGVYRYECGCEYPVTAPPARDGAMPFFEMDPNALPACRATFAMLARGDTKGIFQLESQLGRQWTRRLKPEDEEHVGALGAILRPGPLKSLDERGVSMTEKYCKRKNGEERVDVFHPSLEPILADTFQVLIYQEQMMRIGRDLAGFDPVQVDMLRKSVGKKDQQALAKVRDLFYAGCERQGVVTREQAETVWGWIQKAGRYAFNKAHSMSYGLRGYDQAYQKAHDPVSFFANALYYAREKSDPREEMAELVADAKLFDVPVETPDLRDLESRVSTDMVRVRFGLSDVKGVGEAQVQRLAEAVRQEEAALGRPLAAWSWEEFLFRLADRVKGPAMTAFIKVGAFRWAGKTRRRLESEYAAWAELTEKEREWVRANCDPALGVAAALHKLARPKAKVAARKSKPAADRPRVPKNNKPETLAEIRSLEQEYADLNGDIFKMELGGEASEWHYRRRDDNRKRYKALTKPGPPPAAPPEPEPRPVDAGGGCSTEKRREVVRSLAALLDRPPASEEDHPNVVARDEEQYLGVAVTCTRVDACDTSEVNCTCKEFLAGRTGPLTLGVEVRDCRVVKTKRGKNPGQLMAFLSVADSSCEVTDVVCFPEAWEQYGAVLRAGNTVLVEGYRDKKGSLVVEKAFQL